MINHRVTAFFLVGVLIFAALPLASQGLEFPEQLNYNDFFAAEVFFDGGESFNLFDVAYFEGDASPWPDAEGSFGAARGSGPEEEMKYFFWIRRVGNTGAITYPLSFRRIAEIRFDGPFGGSVENPPKIAGLVIDGEERVVTVLDSGERFSGWYGDKEPTIPGFTQARLTLTDGTQQEVFVKTDGFLGGIDEEFGTYAMLWLRHDGVRRLVFEHNGAFARCPECGAIFYDDDRKTCPFDGETLVSAR